MRRPRCAVGARWQVALFPSIVKLNVRRAASLQDLINVAWAGLLSGPGSARARLLERLFTAARPHLRALPLPLLVQLGQVGTHWHPSRAGALSRIICRAL